MKKPYVIDIGAAPRGAGVPAKRRRSFGAKVLWSASIFAGVVAIGIGITLFRSFNEVGVVATQARLDALAPWFLACRIALLATILGGWPRWVRMVGRRDGWPEAWVRQVSALRPRLILYTAVFELVVIQGGYQALMQSLADLVR